MNIKTIVTDLRFIIGAVVVIAGITVGIIKSKNIPVRVQAVEMKVIENEKSVDKVSNTFDMYIMEQRTIQVQQEKRENLMVDLIKAMK